MKFLLIVLLSLWSVVASAAPTCPDLVPFEAPTKLLCKGTHISQNGQKTELDLPCFCIDRKHAEAAYLYMQAEKDGEVSFNSGWPMWTVLCAAVVGFGLGAGTGFYVASRY